MNVFATSASPYFSALWLDDRRANQMVRESGQLLSTTINLVEGRQVDGLYANFNPNHPCRLWVAGSRFNFLWLVHHLYCLLERSDKTVHTRAREVYNVVNEWKGIDKLPDVDRYFVNCAGNDSKGVSFKHVEEPTKAYRDYLNARWATDAAEPTWKTGKQPFWYKKKE